MTKQIDTQKHFHKTTITSSWTLSKTKIPITIVKAQMPSNPNQKSRKRDNKAVLWFEFFFAWINCWINSRISDGFKHRYYFLTSLKIFICSRQYSSRYTACFLRYKHVFAVHVVVLLRYFQFLFRIISLVLGRFTQQQFQPFRYSDAIKSAMAYQIINVSIACSTVGSDADQIEHQSSASLAFVRGIHGWPVNSQQNMFPFDYAIMSLPALFK